MLEKTGIGYPITHTWMVYLFALWPVIGHADVLEGKVIGVKDGDTLVVLDHKRVSHTIRLAGIDAPEKTQPFGSRSRRHLSDAVFGKEVSIEYFKNDKYGRIIGKVFYSGQDVNFEQVRDGLAWHYKKYEKEQIPSDRELYAETEQIARSQRIGLWADKAPVPPWEFRRTKQK